MDKTQALELRSAAMAMSETGTALGDSLLALGGQGSGNFGHEGRPGERGGSGGSGDAKAHDRAANAHERAAFHHDKAAKVAAGGSQQQRTKGLEPPKYRGDIQTHNAFGASSDAGRASDKAYGAGARIERGSRLSDKAASHALRAWERPSSRVESHQKAADAHRQAAAIHRTTSEKIRERAERANADYDLVHFDKV